MWFRFFKFIFTGNLKAMSVMDWVAFVVTIVSLILVCMLAYWIIKLFRK